MAVSFNSPFPFQNCDFKLLQEPCDEDKECVNHIFLLVSKFKLEGVIKKILEKRCSPKPLFWESQVPGFVFEL